MARATTEASADLWEKLRRAGHSAFEGSNMTLRELGLIVGADRKSTGSQTDRVGVDDGGERAKVEGRTYYLRKEVENSPGFIEKV